MSVIRRKINVIGREKLWEYRIESSGKHYEARVDRGAETPIRFSCSCGIEYQPGGGKVPCHHIAETERDLALAKQFSQIS